MFDPVETLKAFVRHESVSADSAFSVGMAGARDFVVDLLKGHGFGVEVFETPKHPIILGTRGGRPEWPHVIVYGHYDVQPADPYELWTETGGKPFEPVEKDGRLYGRGAADNKGPVIVHVGAAIRLLEKYPELPLRLTFLIEGEEEVGSPSFAGFLEAQKERLQGDFVLLSDSSSLDTENITITVGLRGIIAIEAVVEGPRTDLHSGIHGGGVVNPLTALIDACGSLHKADGTVNVPGFYDDVIPVPEWERDALRSLGLSEGDYAKFLGVKALTHAPGLDAFESQRFAPTLELNGVGGGYQGEGSKTIIPSRAFAKISCRLVPNQDPVAIMAKVEQALAERLPPGVKLSFSRDHHGPPYVVVPPDRENTPADQNARLAAAFRAADAGIREVYGNPPRYLREGGSIPIIGDLNRVLGLDSVMIGLFTPVDNLHAPNESFDLGMLRKGMAVSERVLRSVAGV